MTNADASASARRGRLPLVVAVLVVVVLAALVAAGACRRAKSDIAATTPTSSAGAGGVTSPTGASGRAAAPADSSRTASTGTRSPQSPTPTLAGDRRTGTAAATAAAALRPPAGMKAVRPDQLPKEARDTLALISRGGPFPFRQDGVEFENRERNLPSKPGGYYREYTVITPGSPDRGARRIVTGREGETYYTDDHYDSFSWVVLP